MSRVRAVCSLWKCCSTELLCIVVIKPRSRWSSRTPYALPRRPRLPALDYNSHLAHLPPRFQASIHANFQKYVPHHHFLKPASIAVDSSLHSQPSSQPFSDLKPTLKNLSSLKNGVECLQEHVGREEILSLARRRRRRMYRRNHAS